MSALEAELPRAWWVGDGDELALRLRLARGAQPAWAALSVAERQRRLRPVVQALAANVDAVAAEVTAACGKLPVEALAHDVGGALDAARAALAVAGQVLAPRPSGHGWMLHRRTVVERVPHGVVLVISPWNFPLSIPFGQVFAAVLAGNAVLLKPSEVTPAVGDLVERLFAPAALPSGLLQVVHGAGDVGARLIELGPDKICFTGSVATGRRVMAAAAAHPIPVSLELGGVDALVVLDDADLDLASSAAAWGATFNGGQVCASVERVLVDEAVADAFRDRLVEKLAAIDPERDLGPVLAERQLAVYEQHLADARRRGLRLHGDGARTASGRVGPVLIEGEGVEASLAYREETFGPFVAFARFRGDADAVRLHNATDFGLTASVFGADRARAVARQLRVGLVSVNDVAATLHAFGDVPWGGVGRSGFGNSHGPEALLDLTRPRVLDEERVRLRIKRPWWYPYDPHQVELMSAFTRLVAGTGARSRGRAALELGRSAARLFSQNPRR